MEGEAAIVLPAALVGEDIVRAVLVQPVEAVVQRQVGAELGQAAGAVLAAAVLVFPRQQKYDKARMAARRRTEKTAFMCASRWNLCRVFLIVTQHAPKCVIIFEKFQKLMGSLRLSAGGRDDMKLKFTRKTWYFLLLASAAASMLNGFAVLSGTSFGLIEQIAFAAAGIAALFLAAEKGSASWEKRNFTGVFVLLMVSYMVNGWAGYLCSALAWPLLLSTEYKRGMAIQRQLQLVGAAEALHLFFLLMAKYGGMAALGFWTNLLWVLLACARGWAALSLYKMQEEDA